jgi:glycosyltransferase involved in cell wall biosynthesis
VTVHILCAMRNAAPFIAECVRSVQEQSHGDWSLLVRDDASTDDSIATLEALAASDKRIRLVERSSSAIGAAAGYFSLLQQVPDGADVACIDADDTWLPTHLAQSLVALASANGPALTHGDLEVVDAQLRPLQPSFWRARHIIAEPTTVRRIAVDNVVTGSTIVMNAALVRLIRARAATGAIFQDSWFALAAAAAGTIIARREITVRYRQHGANTVGAQTRERLSAANAVPLAAKALGNRAKFRGDLARTAAQAGAFAESYAELLSAADRDFLTNYAALPTRVWPARALGVLTMRAYPGRSLLSAIGEALRC